MYEVTHATQHAHDRTAIEHAQDRRVELQVQVTRGIVDRELEARDLECAECAHRHGLVARRRRAEVEVAQPPFAVIVHEPQFDIGEPEFAECLVALHGGEQVEGEFRVRDQQRRAACAAGDAHVVERQ